MITYREEYLPWVPDDDNACFERCVFVEDTPKRGFSHTVKVNNNIFESCVFCVPELELRITHNTRIIDCNFKKPFRIYYEGSLDTNDAENRLKNMCMHRLHKITSIDFRHCKDICPQIANRVFEFLVRRGIPIYATKNEHWPCPQMDNWVGREKRVCFDLRNELVMPFKNNILPELLKEYTIKTISVYRLSSISAYSQVRVLYV